METIQASRRDMLLAPLLAALPMALIAGAQASPLDPAQTIIRPPDQLKWVTGHDYPEHSVESCALAGDTTQPGLYYTLIRWWPGYMSSPHFYSTDRLCVVVSGTWWCNSGPDFDPAATVPVAAGSFVHRVAHTPHYDGVIAGHAEPAIIAICGIGPINYTRVDPSTPGWRKV
jgi:hypothetical protein